MNITPLRPMQSTILHDGIAPKVFPHLFKRCNSLDAVNARVGEK